jgi:hypothetical protein
MHAKRPLPLYLVKPRPLCPVCGQTTYSRGGIHPQCAQERADKERMDQVKAKRNSETSPKKTVSHEEVKSWHKRCPKCRAEVHIRCASCDCGHHFPKRQKY